MKTAIEILCRHLGLGLSADQRDPDCGCAGLDGASESRRLGDQSSGREGVLGRSLAEDPLRPARARTSGRGPVRLLSDHGRVVPRPRGLRPALPGCSLICRLSSVRSASRRRAAPCHRIRGRIGHCNPRSQARRGGERFEGADGTVVILGAPLLVAPPTNSMSESCRPLTPRRSCPHQPRDSGRFSG